MKKIIKICTWAVLSAMLLGGCGDKDTPTDEKKVSSEIETETEQSKNEKEEKESGKASEANDGREASSENSEKSEDADQQSSQNSSGDLIGEKSEYADTNVGDTITFGHYEQDNDTANGAEEIEWLVLAKEDDRILVISQYALDCQPYNTEDTSVTWEVCTLRSWLNDAFYNTAFTDEEQGKIVTVTNSNPDASDYMEGLIGKGGNATSDNIFCLSYEEALAYFASDEARRCTPTAYAVKKGARTQKVDSTVRCAWWLRSPGGDQRNAMSVSRDGALGNYIVIREYVSVRPALWISVN